MKRIEAVRALVELAGRHPILSNLGTNTYDLFAVVDRPENFYMWGAMGSVSSIGLGLALARPDLLVVVLDGDGSLLMNLGSLATIGAQQPHHLVHIVFDNRMARLYAIPGPGSFWPWSSPERRPRASRAVGCTTKTASRAAWGARPEAAAAASQV